jgi:polysaccharide export outer membrane protein
MTRQKEEYLKQLTVEKAKHQQELKAKQEEMTRQKEEYLKQLTGEKAKHQEELKAKQEELARQKEEGGKIEERKIEVAKIPAEPQPALEREVAEREYYIGAGDVFDVSVWQVPDLSRPEVIVRPDGKLSLPLIGDIKAEGITLTQLSTIITERLKEYVKNPQVSVMLRRFGEQGNKVIVLGEIQNPGVYKFDGPPTVTEVIASAGGYTKYAVLNSVMIIRGDIRTKPEAIRVNFAKILQRNKVSENIVLKPNDIVYLPCSFVGKFNTFLEIIQPAINDYMSTLSSRQLQQSVHSKMSR